MIYKNNAIDSLWNGMSITHPNALIPYFTDYLDATLFILSRCDIIYITYKLDATTKIPIAFLKSA